MGLQWPLDSAYRLAAVAHVGYTKLCKKTNNNECTKSANPRQGRSWPRIHDRAVRRIIWRALHGKKKFE